MVRRQVGCPILAKAAVILNGKAHGAHDTKDGCGVDILDLLSKKCQDYV